MAYRANQMTVLLEVKNISKSYQVKSGMLGASVASVLHDVSFQLQAGQILAVVGESGSGKSTLARQVVMLEQPDAGEMLLDGTPFLSVVDIYQRVRMIFQNPAASLDPRKRIYQLLEEPLKNYTELPGSQCEQLIYQSLERVGLHRDQAGRYPHMLSGGQRQRVAIARALILSPEVIVADEAVSALDVSVQAQILNLIMDLRSELGMSWLFITHDISVVNVIADRVMVLYAGRVMESGPVREVLGRPAHPYTKKLLQSVPGAGDVDGMPFTEEIESPVKVSEEGKSGCVFRYRCPIADHFCAESVPPMISLDKRSVACFKAG
ncbi:MAG: ATP-binding cassette domain-containing protein [Gammaproteobacteria bacterium]|nr:ATP-binding cassette domain-containing protein [Gammaproteobacteria bacterium]MDX2487302.1 ATP-binding cassette domain-containing protein [Gammaproteobacteria bacterium]